MTMLKKDLGFVATRLTLASEWVRLRTQALRSVTLSPYLNGIVRAPEGCLPGWGDVSMCKPKRSIHYAPGARSATEKDG